MRGTGAMVEGNIWMASADVYIRNWKWVLGYIGMAGGLTVLEKFTNINAGTSIVVGVMMSTFLAIPAHIAVLTQLDADKVGIWLKERPKAFFAFVSRCLLLGLLGIVVPFVLVIVLAVGGVDVRIAMLAGFLVWVLSGVAAFAKWGTMLPAIIADDDRTLAAAGERGSKVFGYAFPRLLVSFGLLAIVLVAIFVMLSVLLGVDHKSPNFASLILSVAAGMGGAYQIVMTSVILSRSYLRARPAAPPSHRMAFALGK